MLTRLQRDHLKVVADAAFKLAGGNPACALISRITRVATFSDYINVAFEDRAVPLDVAIDIDLYALERGGEPWLIRAAAALLGFVLVKLPTVTHRAQDELAALLKSAKETTEAVAAGWAAREDGVITEAERIHVITEIDEAIAALLNFKATLGGLDGVA